MLEVGLFSSKGLILWECGTQNTAGFKHATCRYKDKESMHESAADATGLEVRHALTSGQAVLCSVTLTSLSVKWAQLSFQTVSHVASLCEHDKACRKETLNSLLIPSPPPPYFV